MSNILTSDMALSYAARAERLGHHVEADIHFKTAQRIEQQASRPPQNYKNEVLLNSLAAGDLTVLLENWPEDPTWLPHEHGYLVSLMLAGKKKRRVAKRKKLEEEEEKNREDN